MRIAVCWWPVALVACCLLAASARSAAPPESHRPGARIVFSSNRSGDWRIWTVQPDGSGLKPLTGGKPGEHDADPAVSPDGKSILFSSTRGGAVGVWKMAADGTSLERICDGDQAEWSPDGREIVFRREEKLLVRDLENGRERQVFSGDFPHPSGPTFSPDGKTIAFACRWEAGNAVYLVPAEGGTPKKLYGDQGACEPHWSPDGKRIVYETETHVATINADGTGNRPLTWFGGVQRYPRVSPDGRQIVFCQGMTERGPWELYVMPVEGGSPTKLTEGGSDMNPDWR